MTIECKKCGHVWENKVSKPKECPKCKNRKWNERKKFEYKRIMLGGANNGKTNRKAKAETEIGEETETKTKIQKEKKLNVHREGIEKIAAKFRNPFRLAKTQA